MRELVNNLALLKLSIPMPIRLFGQLPVCTKEKPHGTRLGSCGMGADEMMSDHGFNFPYR